MPPKIEIEEHLSEPDRDIEAEDREVAEIMEKDLAKEYLKKAKDLEMQLRQYEEAFMEGTNVEQLLMMKRTYVTNTLKMNIYEMAGHKDKPSACGEHIKYLNDFFEGITNLDINKEVDPKYYDAISEKITKIEEMDDSPERKNELRKKVINDAKDRNSVTRNEKIFIGAVIGITVSVTIAGLLVNFLKRRALDQPTSDIPLDPNSKKTFTAVHDLYLNQSEESHWNKNMVELSTMALTGKPPTLGDQLLFMSHVKDFSPLSDPFVWSSDDLMVQVKNLSALFDTASPEPYVPLYKELATLSFQDQLIPRAIKAEVMQFALADIAMKYAKA